MTVAVLETTTRLKVTQTAREVAEANPAWKTPRGSSGECRYASIQVARYLEFGISESIYLVEAVDPTGRARVGYGRFCSHVACVIGGDLIVDLTARQFDPLLPSVWVTDLGTWMSELAFYFGITPVLEYERVDEFTPIRSVLG